MPIGVGTSLAVLSWAQEEEEINPGEITYGLIPWCNWEEGGVQCVDDIHWEGLGSGRRRACLLVGRELSDHMKSKISHTVVPGAVGPHGGKDLVYGA